MSSYSELIKNFEKIRAYMRDFYVYGFKSRDEYQGKSARSYDDERRRLESWLGDHMSFVRTPEGKNVFISIDSRTMILRYVRKKYIYGVNMMGKLYIQSRALLTTSLPIRHSGIRRNRSGMRK